LKRGACGCKLEAGGDHNKKDVRGEGKRSHRGQRAAGPSGKNHPNVRPQNRRKRIRSRRGDNLTLTGKRALDVIEFADIEKFDYAKW